MHQPIKGDFNSILSAISLGSGKGKKAALALRVRKEVAAPPKTPPKKP
jgi:hypothetical protein